jgi:hypothetical protein
MSRCAWVLILVLSEALVSPALLLLLLFALWFLVPTQPWSMGGFVVCFGNAVPLQFGRLSLAPKAQVVVPICLDSDHSTSCFALVLWGLDQKLLILAWVTLGLFLGVLTPLSLADRAASALGLWSGGDGVWRLGWW